MKLKLACLCCLLLSLVPGTMQAEPGFDGASIEIDGRTVAAFSERTEYHGGTAAFRDGWFSKDALLGWLSAPAMEDSWLAPGAHTPGEGRCRAVNLTVRDGTRGSASRSPRPAPPPPAERIASVLIGACPVSWTVEPGDAPGETVRLSDLRIRFLEIGVVR